jgi:molecular chaperone GrpE
MAKSKKQEEIEQAMGELTLDLKRTRADFENYRKRVDAEKTAARESGQASAILKLLPVIDNIERAIAYTPEELKDNAWVQSVANLVKHLEKSIESMNLARIDANPGTKLFNLMRMPRVKKRSSPKSCKRATPSMVMSSVTPW